MTACSGCLYIKEDGGCKKPKRAWEKADKCFRPNNKIIQLSDKRKEGED